MSSWRRECCESRSPLAAAGLAARRGASRRSSPTVAALRSPSQRCAPTTKQPRCRRSAECSLPLPADHKLLAAFARRRRRPARRSRRRPRHREIRLRRRAAPSNTRQQALLARSRARHDNFAQCVLAGAACVHQCGSHSLHMTTAGAVVLLAASRASDLLERFAPWHMMLLRQSSVCRAERRAPSIEHAAAPRVRGKKTRFSNRLHERVARSVI